MMKQIRRIGALQLFDVMQLYSEKRWFGKQIDFQSVIIVRSCYLFIFYFLFLSEVSVSHAHYSFNPI